MASTIIVEAITFFILVSSIYFRTIYDGYFYVGFVYFGIGKTSQIGYDRGFCFVSRRRGQHRNGHEYHFGIVIVVGVRFEGTIGFQNRVGVALEYINNVILQTGKGVAVCRGIVCSREIVAVVGNQAVGEELLFIHRHHVSGRGGCISSFPHEQEIGRRNDAERFQRCRHRLQRHGHVYDIEHADRIGGIEAARFVESVYNGIYGESYLRIVHLRRLYNGGSLRPQGIDDRRGVRFDAVDGGGFIRRHEIGGFRIRYVKRAVRDGRIDSAQAAIAVVSIAAMIDDYGCGYNVKQRSTPERICYIDSFEKFAYAVGGKIAGVIDIEVVKFSCPRLFFVGCRADENFIAR